MGDSSSGGHYLGRWIHLLPILCAAFGTKKTMTLAAFWPFGLLVHDITVYRAKLSVNIDKLLLPKSLTTSLTSGQNIEVVYLHKYRNPIDTEWNLMFCIGWPLMRPKHWGSPKTSSKERPLKRLHSPSWCRQSVSSVQEINKPVITTASKI